MTKPANENKNDKSESQN